MTEKQDFEFTIESGKAERHYWMDLWRYRELFYILAWRDIAVRYKQTVIGVLWAVIRPLLTMMIFVVILIVLMFWYSYFPTWHMLTLPFDGFRWAISGGKTAFNLTELFVSIAVVILLCIIGVLHFRKTEKTFADVI